MTKQLLINRKQKYAVGLRNCYGLCGKETHIKINQMYRVRQAFPNMFIIFCRECEYYTFISSKGRCYCCGVSMCYSTRDYRERKKKRDIKFRY